MIKEFRLHRDISVPMRFTLQDVINVYGEVLEEEGFNLKKEIYYTVRYDYEEVGHLLKVHQDDRFRVIPANSFYPFAII